MLSWIKAPFKLAFFGILALVIGALIRWEGQSLSSRVEEWVFKMENGLQKSPSAKNTIKQIETWTTRWTSSSPTRQKSKGSNRPNKIPQDTPAEDQKALKNFLDSID